MYRWVMNGWCWCLLVGFVLPAVGSTAAAQDNIYLKTGSRSRITGKLESMTPDKVTVTDKGKSTEIPAGNISKITFKDEPSAVDRARDRFDDGRFDDCLSELQKVDDDPSNPHVIHEMDYLEAFAHAHISLRGGKVTAQNAGKKMVDFTKNHPDSYRYYPATELLGQLFESVGRVDLAEQEFSKMAGSDWPQFKARGLYRLGNAYLKLDNSEQAKQAFEDIGKVDANDDETVSLKQIARVLLAKVDARMGNPDSARATIESMIKNGNPDEKLLFAHLYNALGASHEAQQNWYEAAIAYLHTELLFSTDPEAHAEALKRLSEIWPKLEETDRANRARTTLKNRYRNSYWANQ